MKAYFLDLDGTLFLHGTNELLPGARDLLDHIVKKGYQIIFTTFRGDKNFKNHPIYSEKGALEGIRSLKVSYEAILFNIESPRVVINDGGAVGIEHKTNEAWTTEKIEKI